MAYTFTLNKLAENLKTTYENTIFRGSTNMGDTREKIVIDYLKKVMPRKYGFKSGEIFDENNNNTDQVDVIMFDNLFSTVFTDGTEKIFAPVESTYGIISVKSKMTTGELDNAIKGIGKYNSLKRQVNGKNTLQIMSDISISIDAKNLSLKGKIPSQENINCIFAFDTNVKTETILQKVKACGYLDLIVIPNKRICIIGRSRKEFALEFSNGNKLENKAIQTKNSISLFILFLQIYLSQKQLNTRELQSLVLDMLRVRIIN